MTGPTLTCALSAFALTVSGAPARNANTMVWRARKILGVFRGEFVTRVAVSLCGVPLVSRLVTVGRVLLRRPPAQIFSSVDGRVAVQVPRLKSFRSWSDKGFQDKSVAAARKALPAYPQLVDPIALLRNGKRQCGRFGMLQRYDLTGAVNAIARIFGEFPVVVHAFRLEENLP